MEDDPEQAKPSGMKTPFDDLTQAIRDYGRAAMDNLVHCKAFGRAVIDGYAEWLGCAPERVGGVPATGPFDPRHDYGDGAFNFHKTPVIRLEPVTFGVSLVVDNAEDSGSLWLRTAVRVDVSGRNFEVFVGGQPLLLVPVEFEGALEPVFKALHGEMMAVFSRELAEFRDNRFSGGIGFLAD